MIDLILRKATSNDSEFAYRVRTASLREYLEEASGWDEDEQRRLHEARFGTQDFRVISLNGADVGIMAMVVDAYCVKLYQLCLMPAHQSKGLGRRCMGLVMDEARRLGLPVRLRVMKVNSRGLAFYRRLGFAPTGETGTHYLMESAPS